MIEIQDDKALKDIDLAAADKEAFEQVATSAASVFLNTLISSLANELYKGIFTPADDIDPFNPSIANIGGREVAQEQFRSILSVPIVSFDKYSPLSEFAICPPSDVRAQNNCVVDQSFVTGVSRSGLGQALTIQDAIDENFLHGNWSLIPSVDEAKNQDPACRSYGYCYGNLVKLRKARILSVGWELAANSEFNGASNPVTLQEVVDGFYDCNDAGVADNNNKWCHLIDPNWVLKVPAAQCNAFVPGELPFSSQLGVRQSVCVDSPSCVSENDAGECIGGYGYCTREENIWRFRGDSCPAKYAGCLAFENQRTDDSSSFLLNSVDTEGCNANNPGCRWYRTNKYFDDAGNTDPTDDGFGFLPTGESYNVASHDNDIGLTSLSSPTIYTYDTDDDPLTTANNFSYTNYAFEDRLYLNQNFGTCSESQAGCTELIQGSAATLNLIANSSFEDDEDLSDSPDFWIITAPTTSNPYDTVTGSGYEGASSLATGGANLNFEQQNIALSENRFYTLSFYVNTVTSGSSPARFTSVALFPKTGASTINLLGTTTLGGCSVDTGQTNTINIPFTTTAGEGYKRISCTFTTPSVPTYATIEVADFSGVSDNTYYDAFQLELGSLATEYQKGYGSSSVARTYLTIAPDWLGCSGSPTDPEECGDYTQMCAAADVGCELYQPTAGGTGVPAVISSNDTCPTECVGYETYKQEETLYESELFPLFFIADSADQCTSADVGCTEYTNLDDVERGGEGLEYFTQLRECATPEQDSGSTYYTWEGSESEGYQLRAWQLMESNLTSPATVQYVEGSTTVLRKSLRGTHHVQDLTSLERIPLFVMISHVQRWKLPIRAVTNTRIFSQILIVVNSTTMLEIFTIVYSQKQQLFHLNVVLTERIMLQDQEAILSVLISQLVT